MKKFCDILRHWETITSEDGERVLEDAVRKQDRVRMAVPQLLDKLGVKRREPDAPIATQGDRIFLGSHLGMTWICNCSTG